MIFNEKNVDFTKEFMFFGEPLNAARFDKLKFKKFDDLTEQQLSFFWRPQEVEITHDINDFKNKMNDIDRRIFISNLQYQILLDSVQGRSPVQIFLPICSLPELENWIETWAFSETIHSRSYTYIIKNVLPDPSSVFDKIMLTPEIIERAKMVTRYYEILEEQTHLLKLNPDSKRQLKRAKEALFDCMVSVYALEGIRFYVSFACSYSFVERGLMNGNGKIIKLINRDEWLHQGSTHFIITRWLKGLDDPEMTEIAKQKIENGDLIKIFKDTVEQESVWADWLFSEGNIPMLNADILKTYLNYLADECLNSLGVEHTRFGGKHNPLPWMDNYTKSDARQVAPQEEEISSYLVNSVDCNDDLSDLSDMLNF